MHYEAPLHHFPRDDNCGPALGTSIGIRSNADHSRPERIAAEQVVSQGRHGAIPVRHERAQRWPARPDTDFGRRQSAHDVVLELRSPHLEGDKLTFDVRVLEGDLAGADGPASVFVDIIGLPFTPLSFAGVARRTARRAYWYGAATAGAAAAYGYPYYGPPPYYGRPPYYGPPY
jgi:hypothetical protein